MANTATANSLLDLPALLSAGSARCTRNVKRPEPSRCTAPDGECTNITYYSDVRVPDIYRLGDVNDGWTVLNGPLSAEHGARGPDPHGLADIAIMSGFGTTMETAADAVMATAGQGGPAQRRLLDDASVAYRLGRAFARIEAAKALPTSSDGSL
jgi:3-oxocholest-4-en-26-oyl-CoA dehydrogenase alpha subunit